MNTKDINDFNDPKDPKDSKDNKDTEKGIHIILDIDGTLVRDINSPDEEIIPRPYLKEFLQTCFQVCNKVSIWTAATERWFHYIYTDFIRKHLKEGQSFDLIFTESRCSVSLDRDPDDWKPTPSISKQLRKIWRHKKLKKHYTKHNTLILDDTPETYRKNYGNAIPISTYTGDIGDSELLKVSKLLIDIDQVYKNCCQKDLADTFSVRDISKKI